jgi:hypothetical protein
MRGKKKEGKKNNKNEKNLDRCKLVLIGVN